MEKMRKKILYITGREKKYIRTQQILNLLKKNNFSFSYYSFNNKITLSKLIKIKKMIKKHDEVIVGFYGQILVPLIRLLTNKKIILDSYVLTETTFEDRYNNKIITFFGYMIDKIAYKLSNKLIFCTKTEKKYAFKKHNLLKPHSIIYPCPSNVNLRKNISEKIENVLYFHGDNSKNPKLYNLRKILQIAKKIKNYNTKLILTKELNDLEESNIQIIKHKFKSQNDIYKYIKNAKICFGIFGDSKKAEMVITNKILEYSAFKKCIIHKDTPAIKEIFENKKNILLAKSEEDAVEIIKKIKNNDSNRIGLGAFQTYKKTLANNEQEFLNILLEN